MYCGYISVTVTKYLANNLRRPRFRSLVDKSCLWEHKTLVTLSPQLRNSPSLDSGWALSVLIIRNQAHRHTERSVSPRRF